MTVRSYTVNINQYIKRTIVIHISLIILCCDDHKSAIITLTAGTTQTSVPRAFIMVHPRLFVIIFICFNRGSPVLFAIFVIMTIYINRGIPVIFAIFAILTICINKGSPVITGICGSDNNGMKSNPHPPIPLLKREGKRPAASSVAERYTRGEIF